MRFSSCLELVRNSSRKAKVTTRKRVFCIPSRATASVTVAICEIPPKRALLAAFSTFSAMAGSVSITAPTFRASELSSLTASPMRIATSGSVGSNNLSALRSS